MDSTAAKQFLISKVLEESDLEHVSLSDVERKMLNFTEVGPSLPDIYEVNAEFKLTYETDEYESKIASLLKSARDRDRNTESRTAMGRRASGAAERRSLHPGDDQPSFWGCIDRKGPESAS
jgi:hypothetical protein